MVKDKNLKNWVFSKVHQNKLIYNTCWEDPRCDRMLMDINTDSKIVMITSAGCNALDYLLDNPAEIHCVDMNHRQNALLELKKTSFSNLDYDTFFTFFGDGYHKDAKDVYQKMLQNDLSEDTRFYWDEYIKYFSGKGVRKSFYYRGTSGLLAFGLTKFLKIKTNIRASLKNLFQSISIEEQVKYFAHIEQLIFSNKIVQRLFRSHYALTLAGVPQSQQYLMKESYEGGTMEYIQDSLRRTFTTLDISENYFYQVYMNGSYTKSCCPEYLKQENFEELKTVNNKISSYTTTVSDFLIKNPGNYSHYVLLDHQDWLAANNHNELVEEWKLILENSSAGTKILLRSAAKQIAFFPDFVTKKVKFDYEKAAISHEMDRVGTYASTYIGVVQ